jgi:hypothetical protein
MEIELIHCDNCQRIAAHESHYERPLICIHCCSKKTGEVSDLFSEVPKYEEGK